MPKRLEYEFVRASFHNEGYALLTKNYINSRQRLYYICPKEHKHYISWQNWNHKNKYRCPYCYGNVKYTIGKVREELTKEGYVLVSKIYEGANKRLSYICPEGHKGHITFSNWLRGHRCFECSYGCRRGSNHVNWKGGISKEPYCQDWTEELKTYIKDRDGNRCLNPYCNSKEPDDLNVHHIDYNKKNCSPFNLITICRSCNARANVDRIWHKSWYTAILHRRHVFGG